MSHPYFDGPGQRKTSGNEPDTQPISRKALVSIILVGVGIILPMIVGLLGLGALAFPVSIGLEIVAVIFGQRALMEVHASGDALGGRGLAITGLVLGYVVLAFVVVGSLYGLYFLLTYQP